MFVLDANVMKAYDEALVDQTGEEYEGVNSLLATDCFAYSATMRNEWLACTSALFREWFNQRVIADQLRIVDRKVDLDAKKKLRTKYGLSDTRDQEYIWVANATARKALVSHDIDHYNPKLKEATSAAKAKCKANRSGPLCKFLSKDLGITVGTLGFHIASVATD